MARLLNLGFEMQSTTSGFEASNWYATGINTTTKHGGNASMEISGSIAADAAVGADTTFTASATVYARWYLYIDSLTDGAGTIYMDLYSGATNVTSLSVDRSGSTYTCTPYYNNFASSLSTFTLATDQWLRIECLYDTSPANGSEVFTVRVDGVDQSTSSALTFTTKTVNTISTGVYNGSAGSITDTVVYFDDIAVNNSTGSQNSYPGEGKLVLALPTGAGDNAATTGVYSYINEIPPSNTATSGSTMVELDSNGVIAEYNVTNSSTLGIDSYDTISVIQVMGRIREEAAGTSSYRFRIKSASGGTTTTGSSVDGGNATARTNPTGTTAFTNQLMSYTDPTTGSAWTPTGTNSIDNMQIGVENVDADSTPDLWVLWLGAYIEYVDGSSGGTVVKDIIGGFIPFAR